MSNTNNKLKKAKSKKNDEFFTELFDIDRELSNYREYFQDKVVLCNCDDPRTSNFFKYFLDNFEQLGLKKLISTYKGGVDNPSVLCYQITRDNSNFYRLSGNGDYRSQEVINLLEEADVVVTNPPFSLFRNYVAQLIKYNKEFLIVGNVNALSYKEVFKLIKEDKMWLGYNCVRKFKTPEGALVEGARSYWFTNLDTNKRHNNIALSKEYVGNEDKYPMYDNYNAINVDRAENIPIDYHGVMGVPITFLDKYNPSQFEIIGMISSAGYDADVVGIPFLGATDARPLVNGKNIYARILIRRKL